MTSKNLVMRVFQTFPIFVLAHLLNLPFTSLQKRFFMRERVRAKLSLSEGKEVRLRLSCWLTKRRVNEIVPLPNNSLLSYNVFLQWTSNYDTSLSSNFI